MANNENNESESDKAERDKAERIEAKYNWISLNEGEVVKIIEHPSFWPEMPGLVAMILVMIGGVYIGLTYTLYGLLLVPIGFLLFAIDFYKWKSSYFVLIENTKDDKETGRLIKKTGIPFISRQPSYVKFKNIEDFKTSKTFPYEMIFGFGDITIYTAGTATEDLVFNNVESFKEFESVIQRKM